jgi:geranylgeranyl reductase family protein
VTSAARVWDLAVVGAGPAGTAAALGALRTRPDLSVLLIDRAGFPRDKACGDGIAPHVLDLLGDVGVTGLLDDRVAVNRLRLERNDVTVDRTMRRPAYVVPRSIFDDRLVAAACAAGARLLRHRVRDLTLGPASVCLDGAITARVVVGADGAHSQVRAAIGLPDAPMALALRGYAPTAPAHRAAQVIVFGMHRQPSYAWSFDRGDGLANIGYGEVLSSRRQCPPRQLLIARLEELLPGSTADATAWRGHHLPLSTWRWPHPDGRVLLAGDAAGLVNPLTGEGIYHAVATGLIAGRVAAAAAPGEGHRLGRRYRRAVCSFLAGHLRHTALTAKLATRGQILEPGMLAAAADQRVFDDLVELGLGPGRITPAVIRGLLKTAGGQVMHSRVTQQQSR